ncbi:MFS transporter [Belnapia rosea]|uniref:MFS transporter, DHA2 family, multidrug resistance protein n=1 Tax=Belnapia rosea TaxID=938405 RepID=A0A1G6Y720_9PROT|nr:MFS transporter [Belnapia rosea]SDD85753.1 MFS transporter, DHA2 family, multidrug resistance protein [Belnapia rosea]
MTPQDGLPQPRRSLAIGAILVSIVITVLDTAMINVALPAIGRDLNIHPASVIWLTNAYQIVVVSTLISFASLAEILGFRRVFLSGLALYICASLACAFAPSFPTLVAARVVQGLGASAVMALTAGLIRYTYPARELGRAIGVNAMTVAISAAAGPTLGSAILAFGSWPWLFAVNVPLGLAGIVIGALTLPETPRAHRRFDLVAACLAAMAFGLLFLGIDLLLPLPWLGAAVLAAGLAAAVMLIRRDLSRPAPLLPLDLLRLPPVAVSVLASVCAFSAWSLSFVSLPFHFISSGHDQATTGFMMTPWPLALAFAAPLAGRLSDRMPTAVLCMLGGSALAIALLVLVLLPGSAPVALLGLAVAVGGFGFGFFQTPNNRTMLSAAPKARSGGAGGMQATARLLGQTIGTTLTALAFQAGGGPKLAMAAGAGFALAAAGISLLRHRLR